MIAAACLGLVALACAGARVKAQDETEKGIEKYRQMLKEDPWSNPGLLDADRGEGLWKTPAGPNKVSLEKCDLGKGAGVVDGAFAELPRYFADAGKVMDLETRLMWCMEKLQGAQARRPGEEALSGRRPAGEGPRRHRDLCRQQVERHEVRGEARPAAGEGGGGDRPRHLLPAARARTISPAPPATTMPASASGCRDCRICPIRKRPRRSSASGRPIASRPRR